LGGIWWWMSFRGFCFVGVRSGFAIGGAIGFAMAGPLNSPMLRDFELGWG
jgi:hypothetical protein